MWRPIYHEFLRWVKVSRQKAGVHKTTEITVETDQVWVLRKSRARRGWCATCGHEVDMVTLADAGTLLGWDTHTPKLQPELSGGGIDRGWHWSEAADGTPLICLESLLGRR
jgi:hypothetical protein